MTFLTETAVEPQDRILIEQCIQGNPRAQEALYRRYAKAMYNTALRICRHPEDAEDVLQEAFIQVFQRMDSFRGESTIGAWIKRIVVNHSINRLRQGRPFWESVDEPVLENRPAEPEPGEGEEFRFSVQDIRHAMDRLSEGYRTVFSLYLLEGYDHGEIATILGVSEATSKSQFSRARQRVREMLLEKKR